MKLVNIVNMLWGKTARPGPEFPLALVTPLGPPNLSLYDRSQVITLVF
jgi:hypothetical protein